MSGQIGTINRRGPILNYSLDVTVPSNATIQMFESAIPDETTPVTDTFIATISGMAGPLRERRVEIEALDRPGRSAILITAEGAPVTIDLAQ